LLALRPIGEAIIEPVTIRRKDLFIRVVAVLFAVAFLVLRMLVQGASITIDILAATQSVTQSIAAIYRML